MKRLALVLLLVVVLEVTRLDAFPRKLKVSQSNEQEITQVGVSKGGGKAKAKKTTTGAPADEESATHDAASTHAPDSHDDHHDAHHDSHHDAPEPGAAGTDAAEEASTHAPTKAPKSKGGSKGGGKIKAAQVQKGKQNVAAVHAGGAIKVEQAEGQAQQASAKGKGTAIQSGKQKQAQEVVAED